MANPFHPPLEEEIFFHNMTAVEEEDAASYYFGLADNCPDWWGVPEDQVKLNKPLQMHCR